MSLIDNQGIGPQFSGLNRREGVLRSGEGSFNDRVVEDRFEEVEESKTVTVKKEERVLMPGRGI